MRFAQNLPRDRSFVDEVFHPSSRPNVLARDIVFYMFRLIRGKGKSWYPIPFTNYTIHLLSPLTPSIRGAIDILMKNRKDHEYELRYQEVVDSAAGEQLIGFVHHAREMLYIFFSKDESRVNEFFDLLCYIARLGVLFHEHGSHDAPHFAIIVICDAIWRMKKDIYGALNLHAQNIIHYKHLFP